MRLTRRLTDPLLERIERAPDVVQIVRFLLANASLWELPGHLILPFVLLIPQFLAFVVFASLYSWPSKVEMTDKDILKILYTLPVSSARIVFAVWIATVIVPTTCAIAVLLVSTALTGFGLWTLSEVMVVIALFILFRSVLPARTAPSSTSRRLRHLRPWVSTLGHFFTMATYFLVSYCTLKYPFLLKSHAVFLFVLSLAACGISLYFAIRARRPVREGIGVRRAARYSMATLPGQKLCLPSLSWTFRRPYLGTFLVTLLGLVSLAGFFIILVRIDSGHSFSYETPGAYFPGFIAFATIVFAPLAGVTCFPPLRPLRTLPVSSKNLLHRVVTYLSISHGTVLAFGLAVGFALGADGTLLMTGTAAMSLAITVYYVAPLSLVYSKAPWYVFVLCFVFLVEGLVAFSVPSVLVLLFGVGALPFCFRELGKYFESREDVRQREETIDYWA